MHARHGHHLRPPGTWSVTGDGLLTINGTIQPKTTALYLNFAAGRVNLPATIDASQQPIIQHRQSSASAPMTITR